MPVRPHPHSEQLPNSTHRPCWYDATKFAKWEGEAYTHALPLSEDARGDLLHVRLEPNYDWWADPTTSGYSLPIFLGIATGLWCCFMGLFVGVNLHTMGRKGRCGILWGRIFYCFSIVECRRRARALASTSTGVEKAVAMATRPVVEEGEPPPPPQFERIDPASGSTPYSAADNATIAAARHTGDTRVRIANVWSSRSGAVLKFEVQFRPDGGMVQCNLDNGNTQVVKELVTGQKAATARP